MFKTLLARAARHIVPVINLLSDKKYTQTAQAELLYTEVPIQRRDGSVVTRHFDSHFRITERDEPETFHVEVESDPDRSIASRFWEYDSQTDQAEQQGHDLRPRLSRSVLIALRPIPGLPRELTISLTDGSQSDWLHKVSVLSMAQLEADPLIQRNLIFLMPFFLLHYARDLEKLEQDPAGCGPRYRSLQKQPRTIRHVSKTEGLMISERCLSPRVNSGFWRHLPLGAAVKRQGCDSACCMARLHGTE